MNKQDKELLLKDLCARLPHDDIYGEVHMQIVGESKPFIVKEKPITFDDVKDFINEDGVIFNIKPYLRSMSSMTKEEAIEFVSFYGVEDFLKVNVTQECLEIIIDDGLSSTTVMKLWYEDIHLPVECFDFLLRNHFDFRNLIPMGLALPAPDGMYNF